MQQPDKQVNSGSQQMCYKFFNVINNLDKVTRINILEDEDIKNLLNSELLPLVMNSGFIQPGRKNIEILLRLLEKECYVIRRIKLAKKSYSLLDILEHFEENPLHFEFMARKSANQYVVDNADDYYIVNFAIEHYGNKIDIDKIRRQLSTDKDKLRMFDMIIGLNEQEDHDEGFEED